MLKDDVDEAQPGVENDSEDEQDSEMPRNRAGGEPVQVSRTVFKRRANRRRRNTSIRNTFVLQSKNTIASPNFEMDNVNIESNI
jgi:hypothetical protein